MSTKDIRRLLDLLEAAKEYRYSPAKIVAKLRNVKRLENKENKLKNNCEALSKQAQKYKEIIPLAQLIWDLRISKNELISFKIAVCEAAELYGFPPFYCGGLCTQQLKELMNLIELPRRRPRRSYYG